MLPLFFLPSTLQFKLYTIYSAKVEAFLQHTKCVRVLLVSLGPFSHFLYLSLSVSLVRNVLFCARASVVGGDWTQVCLGFRHCFIYGGFGQCLVKLPHK